MKPIFQSAADIADAIVASVGKDIVLGLPSGIGSLSDAVAHLSIQFTALPRLSIGHRFDRDRAGAGIGTGVAQD